MNSKMYGLVLVGGKSRRMGRDKALLSYNGRGTQLEHTADLLREVCAKTFISLRAEQTFPIPKETGAIFDSIKNVYGPLCGILSAMRAHPEADWLVLACDLPYIKRATLEKLIHHFGMRPPRLTAYRSSHDGLPEPLCAIYPAGSNARLLSLVETLGKSCPRKLLMIEEAELIDQDDPESLDNINTSEEYQQSFDKGCPSGM